MRTVPITAYAICKHCKRPIFYAADIWFHEEDPVVRWCKRRWWQWTITFAEPLEGTRGTVLTKYASEEKARS